MPMFCKKYLWKVLDENGDLTQVDTHIYGPHYDEFKLNDGLFNSIEQAEKALEEYLTKYYEYFEHYSFEQFVLLTVYKSETEE
jgi:hypothetical protein